MQAAKNDQIHNIAVAFGLDENMLRSLMTLHLDEANINEFGRFDQLKETVNTEKAGKFFEESEGHKLPLPKVNMKVNRMLREFIIKGGFDISKV